MSCVAPLVLPAAEAARVDPNEFFLLKYSEQRPLGAAVNALVFPIPMALLGRFSLLKNLLESDWTSSGSGGKQHVFDIPASIGDPQALEVLARYCRLRHRTRHEVLPRDTAGFSESISGEEKSFLQQSLPHVPHLGTSFACLKLADYLQFHDFRLLVSGHVATGLVGKSTVEMRRFLGIATDDESVLFSAETREMLAVEQQWLELPK